MAAIGTAVGRHASLAHEAAGRQVVSQGAHRPEFEIAPKDRPHGRRFRLVDDELALLHVISERRLSAHPHALLLRGGDLVADSLPGDLALELGEGQQHVEREPPHAAGRIEGLSDGDERDALGIKDLDDLGEVCQRPRQPIDLVDDDDFDFAGANVFEQALQRGALHRAAGIGAVVVARGESGPALVLLAHDIGLARFALRVERVELLFEALFRGFAGVNGASQLRARRRTALAGVNHVNPPIRAPTYPRLSGRHPSPLSTPLFFDRPRRSSAFASSRRIAARTIWLR